MRQTIDRRLGTDIMGFYPMNKRFEAPIDKYPRLITPGGHTANQPILYMSRDSEGIRWSPLSNIVQAEMILKKTCQKYSCSFYVSRDNGKWGVAFDLTRPETFHTELSAAICEAAMEIEKETKANACKQRKNKGNQRHISQISYEV